MSMRILSLGAGVQSSTLAFMIERGEVGPVDCAIFADVGNEPKKVYDFLDYIEENVSFPIQRVSAGNLGEDFLAVMRGEKGRCSTPPFSVVVGNRDEAPPPIENLASAIEGLGFEVQVATRHAKNTGPRVGRLWRQCTRDYKIRPILKRIRRMLKERGEAMAVQLIGISTDEAHRMKQAEAGYLENQWPLVDMGMSRRDCESWLRVRGYRMPPKSACYFCPYISNARLREMRDKDPDSYDKAVKFDRALRDARVDRSKYAGDVFIHRDGVPLEDVDLGDDQGELFGEECEGMCGL